MRQESIADARRETEKIADTLASEQQTLLSAAEQLLISLAQLPDVRSRNTATIKPILKRLHGLNRWYSNIYFADRQGHVWAQAVDAKPFSISDRRYFKNAMASGRFSSGEFVISSATGTSAFNFSYPFTDQGGRITGTVNIGIKIGYFDSIMERSQITPRWPEISYLLLDHRGVILGSYLIPKKTPGKPYDQMSFKLMQDGPEVRTFEGHDITGERFVISTRKLRLPHEQSPYIYIQASIPLKMVLAESNKALAANMALLTSFVLLAIAFAWFIGNRSIADRIRLLENASRRLSDGDLNVSISTMVAGGELGRLSQTFDAMAHRLAAREEALRRSEENFRLIVENAQDIIARFDRNYRYMYINPAASQYVPLRPEDFIGKTHRELGFPEDKARFWEETLQKVFKSGEAQAFELELDSIQGKAYFDWRIFPELDDHGKVNHVITVSRDITERRKVEDALRESEKRFRSIFNSAMDGIVLADATSRKFIMGNKTMCSMLGCTEDELRALGPKDIHPQDVMPRVTKHFEETARGAISVAQEIPVKRRDGSVFYADISASALNLGGRAHFMGVFRDVTERKRVSEEQLKLVSIIETSSDLIATADLEGRLLYMNSAGLKLVGLDTIEDVRNKPVRDFHLEADYHRFEKQIMPSILHSGSWIGEIAFRHFKTGVPVPVEMNGFVIRDGETGQPIALANISRDIADRKRTEEEKQKLQAQLLQSQKMESIGQLAGGIAHDFNNILAAIVGYGNVLQIKMPANNPLRIDVDHMLEAADRAAQLTRSLLAFSRKQVLNIKPVHLNEIIARGEKFLRRIIGEDIDMKTIFHSDQIIMADNGQMEQVLMNLATNARDAMPKGGKLTFETDLLEITNDFISAHGFGTPGPYAVISVTDTGIGMDEETKQKIFEPFFTTKDIGRGTGLGMAIVYGIVKQHKGYINVNSRDGKGTTFKIYLPVHSRQLEQRDKTISAAPIKRGTETIMLAEDDATLRTFFRDILTEYGYTVVIAEDGEDAIRKFAERKDEIQLCVIDMIMPKKSGKDAYDEIQRIKSGTKVIFSSGYAAEKVLKDGLPAGSKFIPKPSPPQELLKKIREMLDG